MNEYNDPAEDSRGKRVKAFIYFFILLRLDRQRKVNTQKRKKIVNDNSFIASQIRPHYFVEKAQPVSYFCIKVFMLTAVFQNF